VEFWQEGINMSIFLETLNSSDFQPEKFANFKLSADSTRWTSDILNYVQEEYPEIQGKSMNISFTQKDDQLGYAIGAVTIENVVLPIIVNEFILKPVDVAVINGSSIPFTHETIKTLFTQPDAFSRLVKPEEVESIERLFNRQLVDITRVDKYACSLEDPFFEKIAFKVPKKEVEELKDRIDNDERLKNTFVKNGTNTRCIQVIPM
jgi:hypothetical protein